MVDETRAESSERERELLRLLQESKAINFDQLGELVARVTPEILRGRMRAADYIISLYTSFIKIYILSVTDRIDRLADLREVNQELRG